MPSWAPRPVPVSMAVGVARPRAHGHAMTSTDTAATNARLGSPVTTSQITSVSRAMPMTTGTNTDEIRSASRATGALVAWARATVRLIEARTVSEPTWVARASSRPVVFTVAPVSSSPGPTSTGMDSPVSMEASTADSPSRTTASVAIFSPGRTAKVSPTRSSDTGTVRSVPSSATTVACCAPRSSRAFRASPERDLARASSQRPSSRNVVTRAADSKYSWCADMSMPAPGWAWAVMPGSATRCHSENRYAAATPRETSVSMVVDRCRAFTAVARWNGHAAHVTTGRASSAATHPQCGNWAPGTMDITNTGTENAAATQQRFLRSFIRRCAGVVSSAGSRCSFSAGPRSLRAVFSVGSWAPRGAAAAGLASGEADDDVVPAAASPAPGWSGVAREAGFPP